MFSQPYSFIILHFFLHVFCSLDPILRTELFRPATYICNHWMISYNKRNCSIWTIPLLSVFFVRMICFNWSANLDRISTSYWDFLLRYNLALHDRRVWVFPTHWFWRAIIFNLESLFYFPSILSYETLNWIFHYSFILNRFSFDHWESPKNPCFVTDYGKHETWSTLRAFTHWLIQSVNFVFLSFFFLLILFLVPLWKNVDVTLFFFHRGVC